MWWNKKKQVSTTSKKSTVAIQTIPREFYAGANPVVKFKDVEHEVILGSLNKKISPPTAHKPTLPSIKKVNFFQHWWWVFGILLITFIGVSTWYYVRQARQVAVAPASSLPAVPPKLVSVQEPIINPPTTTTEIIQQTTPTSTVESALDLPSPLIGDSQDTDHDGMTDAEEELFHTDPNVPDTDNDRYTDAHEVFNLYNPAGKEPQKIIDSGLVKDWENPLFGYQIYYPLNWAIGNVNSDYRDVLFSSITGEYIEIRVIDKNPDETFESWLATAAPSERLSDIVPFESVFKVKGKRRNDYLVYYFEDKKYWYVISYHTTNSPVANYRLVAKMLARSFRFSQTSEVIPVRVDTELTPTATATPLSNSFLPKSTTTLKL